MSQSLLVFLIHWIPTFIFILMILFSALSGLIRGFRKSLILCIQAGVWALILFITYLIVAGKRQTDIFLFDTLSKIIGENTIREAFNASDSCNTFQDIFIEWIPRVVDDKEAGLYLILRENGAYLATLANMAVRIVVAIAFSILYIVGVFLLWFIYIIFYPQRRYVKKLTKEKDRVAKEEYEAKMAERNQLLEKKLLQKPKKQKEEEDNFDDLVMEAKGETLAEESLESVTDSEELDEFSAYINSLKDKDDSIPEVTYPEEIHEVTYPEEIHENIKEEKIDNNQPEEEIIVPDFPEQPTPYKYPKRRKFGALIGAWRGLIAGLVFLSFVGGIFSIIGGGNGEQKPVDMDFGDETANLAYSAYGAIESYGTTGIFKVLNTFHDKDNVPFYLFAVDLVFQGKLQDDSLDEPINTNVALRAEIAAYTKFARQTVNLILKYGGDDIKAIVKKDSNDNITDVIIATMSKEGFKEDFLKIIDKFKAGTYFVNLTYSLIRSFANHIDAFNLESQVGSDTLSLIQLLFKKGYFAEEIPYEASLKAANSTEVLPYFTPELLLNKNNTKVLFNMLLSFLEKTKTETTTLTSETDESTDTSKKMDTKKVLEAVTEIIPLISDLTIFKPEYKEQVSGTLERLYQFTLNTYLKKIVGSDNASSELTALVIGKDLNNPENPYEADKYKNVDWTEEILDLADSVVKIIDIYTRSYISNNATVLDNLFNIFNKENEHYDEILADYNDIKENVSNSFLLGDVLGSEYGTKFLASMMSSIAPNLELPELHYSNTLNPDGTTTYGEFYYLLSALQAFAENQNNKNLLNKFTSNNLTDNKEVYDLVSDLCDAMVEKDSNNNTVVDSVLSSTLFQAVFSEFLISSDFGGSFKVYVADSIREKDKDNNLTRLIVKEELKEFFNGAKVLVNKLAAVEDDSDSTALLNAVLNKDVYDALNSKLIEGTLSNFISTNIESDLIVKPKDLINEEYFVSSDTYTSEAKQIIGLFQIPNLDITVLTKAYEDSNSQMNGIITMLKGLTTSDVDQMLNSKLLYYSMSNYMVNNATGFMGDADLIIPNAAKNEVTDEPNVNTLIVKEELEDLILEACKILPEDMSNVDLGKLVNSIIKDDSVCDNLILSATITNMINNVASITDNTKEFMEIPNEYKTAAAPSSILEYTKDNPWYLENKRMMQALDAMVGDELNNGATITDTGFSDKIIDSVSSLTNKYKETNRSKLAVAYDSIIMQSTISKKIDGFNILSDEKKPEVKNGAIYKEEEIESLIDLINLFNLDLTPGEGASILDQAMSSSTISKLLEYYDPVNKITNLDHVYEHKICGLLMTEGIEKSTRTNPDDPTTVKVSADAYETGELYIRKLEVDALITSVNKLNVDLNSSELAFNGDTVSISTLLQVMYVHEDLTDDGIDNPTIKLDTNYNPIIKSKILLQSATDTIIKKNILTIPEDEYLTVAELEALNPTETRPFYDRIDDVALYHFLNVASLFGADNLNASIGSLNIPTLSTDKEKDILRSSAIFLATLTKNLKINIGSIEQTLKLFNQNDYVIHTKDYQNTNILHISGDEAVNLILAIKGVSNDSTTINNITLNTETFKDSEKRNNLLLSNTLAILISDSVILAYKAFYPIDPILTEAIVEITTQTIINTYEVLSKVQINKLYNDYGSSL